MGLIRQGIPPGNVISLANNKGKRHLGTHTSNRTRILQRDWRIGRHGCMPFVPSAGGVVLSARIS
jgi:hypothetical protein